MSAGSGTNGCVIASKRSRKRHGKVRQSGWLVVDGTDDTISRKVTVAFKPSTRGQNRNLGKLLDVSREVYNASLQERRDAWEHPSKTSVSAFDQFKALTGVRQVRPEVFAYGLQPLRGAIRRVDEAFSGFFSRVDRGETPGYPRFKSGARFDTVCYDEPTGWKVDLDRKVLYVQGVGEIQLTRSAARQLRRFSERGGTPKTLTLTRANRAGTAWRAAVGYTGIAVQHPSDAPDACVVGIDRGVVVPVSTSTGQLHTFPKPVAERLEHLRTRIKDLQRVRATKKKHSRAWNTLSKQIKRAHRKAARITANWIAQRGAAAEAAWVKAGSPPLTRPKPRMRRRKTQAQPLDT